MKWFHILGSAVVAGLVVAAVVGPAPAQQPKSTPAPTQPQKSMKELIVGSWTLLFVDTIRPDGTRVPNYGPNPKGLVMFGPDGHYSLQNFRSIRPKFAANDRMKGTPDEIKAAFEGGSSHFGTYTVNEADKTLTFRIEGSAFPNWEGTTQKRLITALVGDDITWTSSTPAAPSLGGERTDLAWKRAK